MFGEDWGCMERIVVGVDRLGGIGVEDCFMIRSFWDG